MFASSVGINSAAIVCLLEPSQIFGPKGFGVVAGTITQQSLRENLDQRSPQPGGPLFDWPPLRYTPTNKKVDQNTSLSIGGITL